MFRSIGVGHRETVVGVAVRVPCGWSVGRPTGIPTAS